MVDMPTQLIYVYFIFDPFKSLYESFDFWMEWIQEGAVFLPKNIWRKRIKRMTNTMTCYIYLHKELEEDQVGRGIYRRKEFHLR